MRSAFYNKGNTKIKMQTLDQLINQSPSLAENDKQALLGKLPSLSETQRASLIKVFENEKTEYEKVGKGELKVWQSFLSNLDTIAGEIKSTLFQKVWQAKQNN